MRRSRLNAAFLTALLIPVLAGSKCKKKGDDISDDPVIEDVSGVQDVETSLTVVAISPSSVAAGTATEAVVRGAGFDDGARVFLGADPAQTLSTGSTTLRVKLPALGEGRYDVEVVNGDGATSVLRQGLSVVAGTSPCANVTVYFDTARDTLTRDAETTLERQLDCLKAGAGPMILEGHADSRGTTDYNLALGDRRANTVARWLVARGISRSRISAVSYGEERPAVAAETEAAWAKNRRVEILASR